MIYDKAQFEEETESDIEEFDRGIHKMCDAMCENTYLPALYLSLESATKAAKEAFEVILKKFSDDECRCDDEEEEEEESKIPGLQGIFEPIDKQGEPRQEWQTIFSYRTGQDPWGGCDIVNTWTVNATLSCKTVPIVP